jgi:hypothetical protein
MQTTFQFEADNRGVSRRMQNKIKAGVYDWERGGYPPVESESFWEWCGKNSFCRKLRNCLIAGGAAYSAAKVNGSSELKAQAAGAIQCAAAVAITS